MPNKKKPVSTEKGESCVRHNPTEHCPCVEEATKHRRETYTRNQALQREVTRLEAYVAELDGPKCENTDSACADYDGEHPDFTVECDHRFGDHHEDDCEGTAPEAAP